MRLWMIPLASLAIATTPVAAETRSASSVDQSTCAASLEKVKGAEGYRMVRKCGASALTNSASAVEVSREPVTDGSDISKGGFIILPFALLSVGLGIAALLDDDDGIGDGGGGLDPASP